MAMTIAHASSLTDSQLLTEIPRLARGEREATVGLIAHLAEFDARRLFEGEGLSSTFRYCVEVLRLSEDAAFNRIEAARAARRYPVVLEMLATNETEKGTPLEAAAAAAPTPPVPRPVVRPIAAERYEIRFTACAETREKLRRA